MLTTSLIDIDPRINKVANALGNNDYNVDILCFANRNVSNNKISSLEISSKIRYIRIKRHKYWSRLEQITQLQFIALGFKIGRNYDIIHANDISTLTTAWLLSKIMRLHFIYDAHEMWTENLWSFKGRNINLPKFIKYIVEMFEKFMINQSALFITVSRSICNEYVQRYRLKDPPLFLPNYVETSLLNMKSNENRSIRKLLNLKPDKFVTLYLGGISPLRNIENVIKAHKYLPEKYVFVIRGPGIEYYQQEYFDLAKRIGIEGRIFTLSPVGREEILAGAVGADCGILMLKNLCKNFYWFYPNKLFEYMLSKMPVAVSNFPDVSRLVEKEKCGVTFDPDDPKSIASAIRFIGDNPELADEMKKRGFASIIEKYNWERCVEGLVDAYNRL